MKIIKRILLLILSLIMITGLFSCKKKNEDETDIPDISFLDYSIIRPDSSSVKLLDEISVFYGRLMSVSGQSNSYETDFLKSGEEADPEAREILVGHTNRPETKEVLDKLSKTEYAIAVVGNKVVITGKTDSITVEALRYFSDTYLGADATGVLAGDMLYTASADVAVLIEDGKPNYTIIRSDTAGYMNKDLVNKLYGSIRSITGVAVPSKNDGAAEDPEALQILFGNTAYKETAEVEAVTSPEGYTIDFIGNKIVVFAWTAEAMEAAVAEFTEMITYSWYTDGEGLVNLCLLKDKVSSDKGGNATYYKDVPLDVNGRRMDSIYDAYDNTMMLYWANAGAESFGSYTTKLEERGFEKYQSFAEDNSVLAATYVKNKAMVHVYYLKRVSELRVITQNNAVLPTNSTEYTKVCDVAVTQLGLDYSDKEILGGMGYLILLEDGTFAVIDGGDPLKNNAETLYKLMREQTPNDDIVIRAWIVTHSHKDHFGVYNEFARYYKDEVTVETLIGNDVSDYINANLEESVRGFSYSQRCKTYSGCKYMKIHTGQQLFLPGITLRVLYTHEDVYPNFMPEVNSGADIALDATVTKDGTRFVFLADVTEVGAGRIVNMYGEDMKCDVMQVGHHGNKGGSLALYKLCAPDIALWPASSEYCERDYIVKMSQNKWLLENVAIIARSGDGNYTISFAEKIDLGENVTGDTDENGDYTRLY